MSGRLSPTLPAWSHLLSVCVCVCADMSEGSIGNMAELGITESFQVKRQVLLSASEAAEMILRVDNIIKAAPRSV